MQFRLKSKVAEVLDKCKRMKSIRVWGVLRAPSGVGVGPLLKMDIE